MDRWELCSFLTRYDTERFGIVMDSPCCIVRFWVEMDMIWTAELLSLMCMVKGIRCLPMLSEARCSYFCDRGYANLLLLAGEMVHVFTLIPAP